VLRELEAGKTVELKYQLVDGNISTHEITLEEGMIYDYCSDDNSSTFCSIREFKYGFYSKAFECNIAEYDTNNT
jgi:hypothetical protein